jgi:hypothetical protein
MIGNARPGSEAASEAATHRRGRAFFSAENESGTGAAAMRWQTGVLIAFATLGIVFLTRWPLAPTYLFYFDNINFALALQEFNPSLHQPQPPGYPLFVGLSRLVHTVVPGVEATFLWTGMLGATAAILLLWRLGESMFGAKAGLAAALLLLVNPAFWLAGLGNHVRLFLAAGALLVALPAWFAWKPESPNRYFLAAAGLLGVAAGFRPDLFLFLLPLLAATAIHSKRDLRTILLGTLLLVLCALPWLAALTAAVGGLAAFYEIVSGYLRVESHRSVLFGAPGEPAATMISWALTWNFMGALSWIWALPWAARQLRARPAEPVAVFLALWFLPAFLFHAFVHVGDPDQTLVTIPVACLLGGWVLSRLPGSAAAGLPLLRWALCVALAVSLNVYFFFRPLPAPANAAAYKVVTWVDGTTAATFDAIRELKASGPVYLISCTPFVAWRKVAYYFPEDPMLVLSECPGGSGDLDAVWVTWRGESGPPSTRNGEILLPAGRRIVWLLPEESQVRTGLELSVALRLQGPLSYSDLTLGREFEFNGHRFRVEHAEAVQ